MRTAFLIDGFNLYHSLSDAEKAAGSKGGFKWLNITSLCTGLLPNIHRTATLGPVYYFTAYANQRISKDPNVVARHQSLVAALESTGVTTEIARFKKKKIKCSVCGRLSKNYEEKESDVAIAVKLLEVLHKDEADAVAIVSGDTDYAPALRTARRLFPTAHLIAIFPFNRTNDELKKFTTLHLSLSASLYRQHQFPDSVALKDGSTAIKPPTW